MPMMIYTMNWTPTMNLRMNLRIFMSPSRVLTGTSRLNLRTSLTWRGIRIVEVSITCIDILSVSHRAENWVHMLSTKGMWARMTTPCDHDYSYYYSIMWKLAGCVQRKRHLNNQDVDWETWNSVGTSIFLAVTPTVMGWPLNHLAPL